MPAIRLRALDAAGNGVPGLRVRLNVFDSIYPNMPPVARVVTCSLLKGKDGEIEAEKAVPIDGMARNEVLEMKRDGQLVCETDKDGYVNMRVSHPLIKSFEPPGGGEEEPIELNMPEYIKSSSPGTIFYEYAAYRPIYETVTNRKTGARKTELAKLERACSIDLQMDVKSRVASVEWDDARMTDPLEQQRTAFNIITAEGALEENPNPEYSPPSGGNPFNDLKKGNTTSLETKELDIVTISGATDLDAMFEKEANSFNFSVKDENGIGVKNKMLRFDWVQLPSYLTGWATKSPHECYSRPEKKKGKDGPVTVTGCLHEDDDDGMIWAVKDYGLNTASVSQERVKAFPFEPFATMAVAKTDGEGFGAMQVGVHEGHPGVYGFTMEVDGIRSSPLLFNVKSLLHAIEIVRQPGGSDAPGGDVPWRVKSTLREPPRVRLTKADSTPLSRYQVFARAVHPDTEADLDDVLFDMADGYGTGAQRVRFNPTGAARSTPASDDGESLFPNLQLFDAKNGTRFKLKIYFRVTQA